MNTAKFKILLVLNTLPYRYHQVRYQFLRLGRSCRKQLALNKCTFKWEFPEFSEVAVWHQYALYTNYIPTWEQNAPDWDEKSCPSKPCGRLPHKISPEQWGPSLKLVCLPGYASSSTPPSFANALSDFKMGIFWEREEVVDCGPISLDETRKHKCLQFPATFCEAMVLSRIEPDHSATARAGAWLFQLVRIMTEMQKDGVWYIYGF